MIETFLRWPHGPAAVAADLLRVAGLLGVAIAAWFFTATDAGVLAFVLAGLVLPRFVGVPAAFDVVFCTVLLIAGWSNVFDLYTRVTWWDIPGHFFCTGVVAVMLCFVLTRAGWMPGSTVRQAGPVGGLSSPTIVVTTATLGLAVSALWEMVEWFAHSVISPAIYVEYNDTIGDMAVGGLGAILAGVILSRATQLQAEKSRLLA